jgi:hypothetical protein
MPRKAHRLGVLELRLSPARELLSVFCLPAAQPTGPLWPLLVLQRAAKFSLPGRGRLMAIWPYPGLEPWWTDGDVGEWQASGSSAKSGSGTGLVPWCKQRTSEQHKSCRVQSSKSWAGPPRVCPLPCSGWRCVGLPCLCQPRPARIKS